MTRISVIIPARDEARGIVACLRSVAAQQVDAEVETIVADAQSADATVALAKGEGVRVVANPCRTIPAGLNRALAAATGDVIVRFDAHAEMPQGYLEACLHALADQAGAVDVGGWLVVAPTGEWGRALGAALASPLGVGNARLWRAPRSTETARDVDSVPFGCFPATTLRAVGGWREELLSNEDFDLCFRLREGGGRVVFDPAIWSVYRPRESIAGIARQYWRYGRWKGVVLADEPRALRPRQLAPPALLAVAGLAVAPGPARVAARAALGAYVAALASAAARSESGWRLAVVLATMHTAWGAGVWSGLLQAVAGRLAEQRR